MTEDHRPTRTWQEIAAEATREKNFEKFMFLTRELERALDERDKKLSLKPPTQDVKMPRKGP